MIQTTCSQKMDTVRSFCSSRAVYPYQETPVRPICRCKTQIQKHLNFVCHIGKSAKDLNIISVKLTVQIKADGQCSPLTSHLLIKSLQSMYSLQLGTSGLGTLEFLSVQLRIGTPDFGIDSPALYSLDYRKYRCNFVVW